MLGECFDAKGDLLINEWLRRRGKNKGSHWTAIVQTLSECEHAEFQKTFNRCREDFLDSCHGRRSNAKTMRFMASLHGISINQAMGQKGKFWQQEPFDHLVRSPQQYDYLRKYIADNPRRGGLKRGEYYYRRFDG